MTIYNPFANLVNVMHIPVFDRRKPAAPFENAGVQRSAPTKFRMKVFILQSEPWSYANLIAALSSAVIAFVMPIMPFIIISIVLVGVDAWTGIVASKRQGESYDNKKFTRTLDKFIYYTVAILLSHGVSVVFINNTTHLVYAISSLICWIEFKSNIDNVSKITGNNLWKAITQAVSSRFKLKDDTTGSK